MQGLVFTGGREVELMSFPDPTPGPGEVVVAIRASGMCGSDLKFYRTPKGEDPGIGIKLAGPVVAGHEPCGVIEAVGAGVDPRQARIGDRVMVHHAHGCDCCRTCRSGWPQMCDNGLEAIYGITANGGHAPYLKAAASNVVKLPDALSFKTGAAVACGTGTAYSALKRLDVSGDDTLVVVGQGPVGLSATLLGSALGARVIALDIEAHRLARATEFGAAHVVNPRETDPVEAILALTGGRGAELAMDTSGTGVGRLTALRATREWGRMCVVGEGHNMDLDISADMLRKQRTIYGSWVFSIMGLADCARFVAERHLPVETLFTEEWSLDQGPEAYRLFDQQTSGKGVFVL
ncbi:zinc-dependent alcohol dehydrogenase family protein [Lichenicoccus roseus]|uniref:Zinc-binding dehydrogenase n=1 Tax=Lichenicoccus roseus TaxID=2683649 RepID=A0A5R9J0Z0_9PROT|nr:zinc-binding dehydrogenase [Lichenicoccus roseus]TLU71345.1 zinc-binding dehydrogenase [Lichenicoccus roseus]